MKGIDSLYTFSQPDLSSFKTQILSGSSDVISSQMALLLSLSE